MLRCARQLASWRNGFRSTQVKSFHSFRLDAINHCLWRGEERVPPWPKAFDLLRYLVDHANRVVPQDEVLEARWAKSYVQSELVKKHSLGIPNVLRHPRAKPAVNQPR